MISSQQTAYVKNRHIDESRRLIFNIMEIAKIIKIEGFLVTMDTKKAFNHNFLISTLKNMALSEFYTMGKDFIKTSGIMCSFFFFFFLIGIHSMQG